MDFGNLSIISIIVLSFHSFVALLMAIEYHNKATKYNTKMIYSLNPLFYLSFCLLIFIFCNVKDLKFKSGASGVIETDLQARGVFQQPRIYIRGEKGEIEVMMDGGLKYCSWDRLNWTSPNLVYKDAFNLEVEDMCNCIEQNKEPLDSGKEAIKAHEVLMAISESARLRGKIILPLGQKSSPLDLIAQEGKLEKTS